MKDRLLSNHWIQTLDGGALDLLAPRPEDIHITTLSIALSRICRFNGHCHTFYSVAEHSLRVYAVVCEVTTDPGIRAAALLHDAHEAFSGFGDVCRPAKSLAPQVASTEARLDLAIAIRFGFDPRLFESHIIKHADAQLLATEARDLMGDPDTWAPLPRPLKKKIVPCDMRHMAWEFECLDRQYYYFLEHGDTADGTPQEQDPAE